jgi:hypothetical protein
MNIYPDESQVANEILDGRIPAWLIAIWDEVYKTDSVMAAKKFLRSQTWSYRLKCWFLHGFILTAFVLLPTEAIMQSEGSSISVIDLLFSSISVLFGVGTIGFLFVIGAFLGALLTSMKSPYWGVYHQLHSYRGIKHYWDKFPSTREAARRLADEQVITLAMAVLQGQKQLTLSSDDPVERQAQLEAIQRSAEEEEERMEELSSTFDFFKGLGLVTIGKGGGYGGHFAQAKKRLAALDAKPE